MADLFDILSQTPVTEFIPPNKTQAKREVTALSKPSGIVFWFRVVPADYKASHVNLLAHDIAQALNRLADQEGVVGVRMEQDTNASNQLIQTVVVTVESDDGTGDADVTLTWSEMWGDPGYPKVVAARNQLNAIASL